MTLSYAMNKLRQLARNASIGPWSTSLPDATTEVLPRDAIRLINSRDWGSFAQVIVRMDGDTQDDPQGVANAEYITYANPELILELLDALEGTES